MDAHEIQTALQTLIGNAELLSDAGSDCEETAELLMQARVETYEDAGVLTSDKGLVIRLSNGREFQVTIVRSR